MNEKNAKKIAAKLLKVGQTKIYVNPDETARIKEAMTKDDVRQLIKDRVIAKRKLSQHSRAGARILA
ncbi:MAG: 50S ribosomal protein L19e, partial [archaeon]|nr:50S ribosomal protein L19e [archaeon]